MTDNTENPSANVDEQGPIITGQRDSNRTPPVVQQATTIQNNADVHVHRSRQMRNQPAGRSIPMDDPRRFRLGRAVAQSVADMISSLNQDRQESFRVTWSIDEIHRVNIIDLFSDSVTVSRLDPRESEAVEDTQPHTMPMPVAVNTRGSTRIDDNNLPPADARVDLIQHDGSLEPIGPTSVRESAMIMTPTDDLHDMEFSEDTLDSRPGLQSGTNRKIDARCRLPKKSSKIRHVSITNEDRTVINSGTVRANTDIITQSHEINITSAEPNTTNVPGSSCPHASDSEQRIHNPGGRIHQTTTPITPLLTLLQPKVTSPVDSGDESSGDSVA